MDTIKGFVLIVLVAMLTANGNTVIELASGTNLVLDARLNGISATSMSVKDSAAKEILAAEDLSVSSVRAEFNDTGAAANVGLAMSNGVFRSGDYAFMPTAAGSTADVNRVVFIHTNGAPELDSADFTLTMKDSSVNLAGGIDRSIFTASGSVDAVCSGVRWDSGNTNCLTYAAMTYTNDFIVSPAAGKNQTWTFKDSNLRLTTYNFMFGGLGDLTLNLDNTVLDLGTYTMSISAANNGGVALSPLKYQTMQFGGNAGYGSRTEINLSGDRTRIRGVTSFATGAGNWIWSCGQTQLGFNNGNANASYVVLNVSDGATFYAHDLLVNASKCELNIGRGAMTFFSSLRMYRGTINLTDEESILNADYCEYACSGNMALNQNAGYQYFNYAMKFPAVAGRSKASSYTVGLNLNGGYLTSPQILGWLDQNGTANITADGGTVYPSEPSISPFLASIKNLKLGEEGLTINSGGYDIDVKQEFKEMDGAGGKGKLVLAGGGVKTLYAGLVSGDTGASTESVLDVKGGKVVLAGGTHENAKLVVRDNATFSLSGSVTGANFAAIQLGDAGTAGVLEFDENDLITVEGAATITRAAIRPTFTLAAGTTCPVFKAKSPVAGAAAAWAGSKILAGTSANCSYAFSTAIDGDYTVFNVTPTDEGSAQERSVVWTDDTTLDVTAGDEFAQLSVASGTKTVSADFVSPVTNEITVATDAELRFTGNASGKSIVKKGGGRLVFDGDSTIFPDGFRVEGGLLGLRDFGDNPVDFASGRQLLTMTDGTIELSNKVDNAFFPYRIYSKGAVYTNAVVIKANSNIRTFFPLMLNGSNNSGGFIKRGEGGLTIYQPIFGRTQTFVTTISGIGGQSGTACIPTGSGYNYTEAFPSSSGPQVFDSNGTVPDYYGGITVAEGALKIKSFGRQQLNCQFLSTLIGLPVKGITKSPELILDGVHYLTRTSTLFKLGESMTEENSCAAARSPRLVVTNGAYLNLTISNLTPGRNSTAEVHPVVDVTGSDLSVDGGLNFNESKNPDSLVIWNFRDHSRLIFSPSSTCYCNGKAVVNFDRSTFAGCVNINGNYPPFGTRSFVDGTDQPIFQLDIHNTVTMADKTVEFNFRNRSVLRLRHILGGSSADFSGTFRFDDSAWHVMPDSETDFSFIPQTAVFGRIAVFTEGNGLEFPVEGEARTLRFFQPITGTGDLRKTGKGTLVLGRSTRFWGTKGVNNYTEANPVLNYTGVTRILEGTLRLDDPLAVTNTAATFALSGGSVLDLGGNVFRISEVAGSGSVTNGMLCDTTLVLAAAKDSPPAMLTLGKALTVSNATVKVQIDNDWNVRGLLKIDGASFVDTTTLDFCRTEQDPFAGRFPERIVIGSYTGSAPNFQGWKQINTGLGQKLGILHADDGLIWIDARTKGALIMVR